MFVFLNIQQSDKICEDAVEVRGRSTAGWETVLSGSCLLLRISACCLGLQSSDPGISMGLYDSVSV
jgi:hypothetical protein